MTTEELREIEERATRLCLTTPPHDFCQCACHGDKQEGDVSTIAQDARDLCAEVRRLWGEAESRRARLPVCPWQDNPEEMTTVSPCDPTMPPGVVPGPTGATTGETHEARWYAAGWIVTWSDFDRQYHISGRYDPRFGAIVSTVAAVDAWIAAQAAKGGGR